MSGLTKKPPKSGVIMRKNRRRSSAKMARPLRIGLTLFTLYVACVVCTFIISKTLTNPTVDAPAASLGHPPQAQTVHATDVAEPKHFEKICSDGADPICWHVIVLKKKKVTFCSAAKVASTTSRDYFYKISDGEVAIPPNARFGVHDANWTRLAEVDEEERIQLLSSTEWSHVFIVKNVLERFVSGYLDKIVHECGLLTRSGRYDYNIEVAHSFYLQYGFDCNKHVDLESFVSFLETIPKLEGHFHPQTPLCGFSENSNYPVTDLIYADHTLSDRLQSLSEKLKVDHPMQNKDTASHSTGAKKKMKDLFVGRMELIPRIMKIFEQDCKVLPKLCDNQGLLD